MGSVPKFKISQKQLGISDDLLNKYRLKLLDLSFDIKQKGLVPEIRGQKGPLVF